METNLTNAARAGGGTLEAVDVVGRLGVEIVAVPAFVNLVIDGPEICEGRAIVRSLELEADERRLADELVNKEFNLVKNANMSSLVGNLEVTISGCCIRHIVDILSVCKLQELSCRRCASPGAFKKGTRSDNLVISGRIGSCKARQRANSLSGSAFNLVQHTSLSADINLVSRVLLECRSQTVCGDLI